MKIKFLYITLICFLLFSCGTTVEKTKSNQTIEGQKIEIYHFEGHSYVRFPNSRGSDWGGHDGNCKNPKHPENHYYE